MDEVQPWAAVATAADVVCPSQDLNLSAEPQRVRKGRRREVKERMNHSDHFRAGLMGNRNLHARGRRGENVDEGKWAAWSRVT